MYNVIQMLRNGQNPQQVVMSILQKQQNPMAANLVSLAQQGKTKEIEQIARNIMASQGKNFDTEFQAFKSQLGLK